MKNQPEYQLQIKPLSVNESYKGRRFKTGKLKAYAVELMHALPEIVLPEPPFFISYEFGFSSANSDVDNPIKAFQDILQKRYKFNDSQVFKIQAEKVHVKKGDEYIKFKIDNYLK